MEAISGPVAGSNMSGRHCDQILQWILVEENLIQIPLFHILDFHNYIDLQIHLYYRGPIGGNWGANPTTSIGTRGISHDSLCNSLFMPYYLSGRIEVCSVVNINRIRHHTDVLEDGTRKVL